MTRTSTIESGSSSHSVERRPGYIKAWFFPLRPVGTTSVWRPHSGNTTRPSPKYLRTRTQAKCVHRDRRYDDQSHPACGTVSKLPCLRRGEYRHSCTGRSRARRTVGAVTVDSRAIGRLGALTTAHLSTARGRPRLRSCAAPITVVASFVRCCATSMSSSLERISSTPALYDSTTKSPRPNQDLRSANASRRAGGSLRCSG
jgi:hypothetical protein